MSDYKNNLKEAAKNSIAAWIFMAAAFAMLFWNEGYHVSREGVTSNAANIAIDVSKDKVDPKNEGKLVNVSGMMETKGNMYDKLFDLTIDGVRYKRTVLMYQWTEVMNTGKARTTDDVQISSGDLNSAERKEGKYYSYEKDWSEKFWDSSKFYVSGHLLKSYKNPSHMPIKSLELINQKTYIGDFKLTDALVKKLFPERVDITPTKENVKIPEKFASMASFDENTIYISSGGGSIKEPKIGDMQIKFDRVLAENASILAKQTGNSFAPYKIDEEHDIYLAENGLLDKNDMIDVEHSLNSRILWIVRVAGFICVILGLLQALDFLEALFAQIPLLRNLTKKSYESNFIAFGFYTSIGLYVTMLMIALIWLIYNPLGALLLLVICLAPALWFYKKREA